MTWKEAQRIFDIQVDLRVHQPPHPGKEVIVYSRKLGWKSRFAYDIEKEHLLVGLQILVIPSTDVIKKLEQYLGEEIIFEEGDTLNNIIKRQKNKKNERNGKTTSDC